jgi:hypothetical protein
MIATYLSRSHKKTTGTSAVVPLNSVVVGLPAASIDAHKEEKDDSSSSVDRAVLYGYKVQEVTITSDGVWFRGQYYPS